jgi:hypothetical protein
MDVALRLHCLNDVLNSRKLMLVHIQQGSHRFVTTKILGLFHDLKLIFQDRFCHFSMTYMKGKNVNMNILTTYIMQEAVKRSYRDVLPDN